MQIAIVLLVSVHVLSSVFWAGSTFALARNGGVGSAALFRPQMGAAAIAFIAGAALWFWLHRGVFGPSETVLSVGIVAALAAAGLQGALRRRPAMAQRLAACLLAVTIICMASARFVG